MGSGKEEMGETATTRRTGQPWLRADVADAEGVYSLRFFMF